MSEGSVYARSVTYHTLPMGIRPPIIICGLTIEKLVGILTFRAVDNLLSFCQVAEVAKSGVEKRGIFT